MVFPLGQKRWGRPAVGLALGSREQSCWFLLTTEGNQLALLHWVTGAFIQLNFEELIPTRRLHNKDKNHKKPLHLRRWSPGPTYWLPMWPRDVNSRADRRSVFHSLCIASAVKRSQWKRSQGFLHCRRNPWPVYRKCDICRLFQYNCSFCKPACIPVMLFILRKQGLFQFQ